MHRRFAQLAVGVILAAVPVRGALAEPAWEPSGVLMTGRTLHTATPLEDGAYVLVVGGYDASGYLAAVERYDAATQSSEARASLLTARHSHTADRLSDGRVLVVGGYGNAEYLASVELYDPSTDEWREVGAMSDARIGHASVVLPDGRVVVLGGYNDSGLVATAELFDPSSETWMSAGAMSSPRARHTATLLADGSVLVAGGFVDELAVDLVERFDPSAMSFEVTASLAHARWFHSAARLSDDTVWIVGGQDELGALASSEIFDPADGTLREGPLLTEPRTQASVTAFEDVVRCGEKVVLIGGFSGATPRASSVAFDPPSGALDPALLMNFGRFEQAHARLEDCSIAVFGGRTPTGFALEIDRLVDVGEGGSGGSGSGGSSTSSGADGDSSPSGCSCSTPREARGSGLLATWTLAGIFALRSARSRRTTRA